MVLVVGVYVILIFIFLLVKDRLKPVPLEEFGAHVFRMHADRDKWFEMEYNVSGIVLSH